MSMHKEGIDLSQAAQPSDTAMMDLTPGIVFRVSGGGQSANFIRIVNREAGIIGYETLSASGLSTKLPTLTSPSEFLQQFLPGEILKYQTIMVDDEWSAFAAFLALVSRWGLERGQVWKLLMCFQDMDIEREMTELRQGREQQQ